MFLLRNELLIIHSYLEVWLIWTGLQDNGTYHTSVVII